MRNNEKILEVNSHLSKLLDSISFELAVNIPDQNSLSLLEIVSMRKSNQINQQQFKELYRQWLESKNIFDIFTAKQVKIYPKSELITNKDIKEHLTQNNINVSLEMLNELYNQLYLSKKGGSGERKMIEEVQTIFSYLDTDGVIHLRPSQIFLLTGAILISENYSIPIQFETFKVHFKQLGKQMCQIDGLVSLRWFKNYLLNHSQKAMLIKNLMVVFKQIEKYTRSKNDKGVPNIIDEALQKWRQSSRFNGVFEAKKKKVDIYKRIFDESEEIFFNGRDSPLLNESYFIKKYGQESVKILEIDNALLREFSNIVNDILNQYVSIFVKVSLAYNNKNSKISNGNSSSTLNIFSTPLHNTNINKKKYITQYQQKSPLRLQMRTSDKQKTPQKKGKGNETKRNRTPKHQNTSPYLNRQFGSTQKEISKNKYSRELTPTKSYQGGYHSAINTHVYRGSKKEGLEKDSFYQKLFFFRNKRVESYDIVMKRLKGK